MIPENPAKSPLTHYLITGILILVIGYFLLKIHEQSLADKREKTELKEHNNELYIELQESHKQRLLLLHTIDSLNIRDEAHVELINKKNREIRAIKGKFDKLTNRELELKMTEEWQKSVK